MYNRYRGSGSRPERVESPAPPARNQSRPSPLPPQQGGKPPPRPPQPSRPGSGRQNPAPKSPEGESHGPEPTHGGKKPPAGQARRGLEHILSRLDPGKLETEDLLVLAILWLLYRDSGDKELLIAMGAYLFL